MAKMTATAYGVIFAMLSQVLYVTGTTRRPVPLEHSLYYARQLHPICRGDTFLPEVRRLSASQCL